MKRKNNLEGSGVIFLTLGLYIFSVLPQTKAYSFHLLLIAFVVLISLMLFKKRQQPLFIYTLMMVLLLSVGVTGWFFSPLFYWLYLAAIALSFLFTPLISSLFVATLVVVFIPNVGSIDATWDVLTLISLLLVIPLTYFLREEYLHLKENEKKILILEREKARYGSRADEVLANKVTAIAAELREKINDVKQMAFVAEKKAEMAGKVNFVKMAAVSQEALETLKKFEEKTTGKKLVK